MTADSRIIRLGIGALIFDTPPTNGGEHDPGALVKAFIFSLDSMFGDVFENVVYLVNSQLPKEQTDITNLYPPYSIRPRLEKSSDFFIFTFSSLVAPVIVFGNLEFLFGQKDCALMQAFPGGDF